MKKLKFILCIAGMSILAACSNSEYEFDNLFPEEFHKILYIKESGKQNITVYKTGTDNIYTFSVYKAGSDPSLEAHTKLNVLSQEVVDEDYSELEGVNYKVIPQNCYEISQLAVDLNSGEQYKKIDVALKPIEIETLLSDNQGAAWLLPIEMTSENDSINAERNRILLIMDKVIDPIIGFNTPYEAEINYEQGVEKETKQTITINSNIDRNQWDVGIELSVDDDYVNQYNQDHGTNYVLLDPSIYEMPEKVDLIASETSVSFDVSLTLKSLPLGTYMLPIRISNLSQFSVDDNAALYLLKINVIYPRLDRTSWVLTAIGEEPAETPPNGLVTSLIDGRNDTFWHSPWAGGNTIELPHWIIIDTQAQYIFKRIGIFDRLDQRYVDEGEFYVSNDNLNWTKVGDFKLNGGVDEQIFDLLETEANRYFKIVITKSKHGFDSCLAEIYLYGTEAVQE